MSSISQVGPRPAGDSDSQTGSGNVENLNAVTPGCHLDGRSGYLEPVNASNEDQSPISDDTYSGPAWNANTNATEESLHPASSPNQVSIGAADGIMNQHQPLRGDSSQNIDLEGTDPRAAQPGLNLSGRVISATFCVPYEVSFAGSEVDWKLEPRRGTSALFYSFSYLASSSSPWKHTLVGWTGEVKQLAKSRGPSEVTSKGPNVDLTPLNKASAPIPVNGETVVLPYSESDEIRLTSEDQKRLETQLERDHGGRIVPVWLVDEVDEQNGQAVLREQSKWRTYAENQLYTLFHYKQNEPMDGRGARTSWANYYRMNQKFADKILDIYSPGDIVLIHNYQLMLLPILLRQRIPNIYVGFFLHTPFPSSELYRCLTRRKELLEGALGANMIGFQSYSYARHFSSCCTRILGFESSAAGVDAYGAQVAVGVFPIGINAPATEKMAFKNPLIAEKVEAIRDLYAGKKIIIGRDRLDSVRGVVQKLQAFDMFLERYPKWRGKVVLIQVTCPGGTGSDAGDDSIKVLNKISDLVGKINGAYGSLSFAPVQHFPQYLAREEYFALLRVADVGLITSVRDGMNTTSLEYVVCQKDNHGPLILSEFSGTAGSLSDAIHINPWDLGGVADAIERALTMSTEERRTQHGKLFKSVIDNNVQTWTNRYLKSLLSNLSSVDQAIVTPALDKVKLLSQYRLAKKRLLMLDYDGTLTPIVKDPQAAVPSDRMLRTIKKLASDPSNAVWIISGRDQAFLEEWMGHISELGLSAEHGSFLRLPRAEEWENLTDKTDMSWQQAVMQVFQHYTERTQGSFIERKKIAVTWHYRRADPEYGAYQARECQKHLESTVAKQWDVEVMTGKANLEVRPRFVNKGEIAKRLVKLYGGSDSSLQFVLCSGDDFTDEDMFRALQQSSLPAEQVFSVTVGASSKQTLATWHLLEPADVISTLALLSGSADANNVGAVAMVEGSIPESR